jgi:ATP-dependent DNA ligase
MSSLRTDRYPAIAAAAAKVRAKSFRLDGEAVVTGEDGVAVFDALHRRRKATDAMLYAFDLLERGSSKGSSLIEAVSSALLSPSSLRGYAVR